MGFLHCFILFNQRTRWVNCIAHHWGDSWESGREARYFASLLL